MKAIDQREIIFKFSVTSEALVLQCDVAMLRISSAVGTAGCANIAVIMTVITIV